MVKAILFDLDGVLVDAKDWHFEALNRALENFGLEPISREDHEKRFDGLPTLKKLNLLVEQGKIDPKIIPSIQATKNAYTQLIGAQTSVFNSDILAAIKNLKLDGYKIGCCSNSVRSFVEDILQRMQIINDFDLILSNEDVIMPKPDPEIYRKAAHIFGLKTEECLVLEDNKNGIDAVLAAGCKLLQVRDSSEVKYGRIVCSIHS